MFWAEEQVAGPAGSVDRPGWRSCRSPWQGCWASKGFVLWTQKNTRAHKEEPFTSASQEAILSLAEGRKMWTSGFLEG